MQHKLCMMPKGDIVKKFCLNFTLVIVIYLVLNHFFVEMNLWTIFFLTIWFCFSDDKINRVGSPPLRHTHIYDHNRVGFYSLSFNKTIKSSIHYSVATQRAPSSGQNKIILIEFEWFYEGYMYDLAAWVLKIFFSNSYPYSVTFESPGNRFSRNILSISTWRILSSVSVT